MKSKRFVGGFILVLHLLVVLPLTADSISVRLEQLYTEYKAMGEKPMIGQLVELDRKLREFIRKLPEYRPDRNEKGEWANDDIYWKEKYGEMGIGISRWTEKLVYGGIHLTRAHELDPHSPRRSSTFFAAIHGESHWGMPDIKAAFQYVREFPNGPFIAETMEIIAGFFTDLYMIHRDEDPKTRKEEPVEYKSICYKAYFTKKPVAEQRKRARKIAIFYYRKYLKLCPDDAEQKRRLQETLAGTINGWRFCAD
jgi:hypothetical protein